MDKSNTTDNTSGKQNIQKPQSWGPRVFWDHIRNFLIFYIVFSLLLLLLLVPSIEQSFIQNINISYHSFDYFRNIVLVLSFAALIVQFVYQYNYDKKNSYKMNLLSIVLYLSAFLMTNPLFTDEQFRKFGESCTPFFHTFYSWIVVAHIAIVVGAVIALIIRYSIRNTGRESNGKRIVRPKKRQFDPNIAPSTPILEAYPFPETYSPIPTISEPHEEGQGKKKRRDWEKIFKSYISTVLLCVLLIAFLGIIAYLIIKEFLPAFHEALTNYQVSTAFSDMIFPMLIDFFSAVIYLFIISVVIINFVKLFISAVKSKNIIDDGNFEDNSRDSWATVFAGTVLVLTVAISGTPVNEFFTDLLSGADSVWLNLVKALASLFALFILFHISRFMIYLLTPAPKNLFTRKQADEFWGKIKGITQKIIQISFDTIESAIDSLTFIPRITEDINVILGILHKKKDENASSESSSTGKSMDDSAATPPAAGAKVISPAKSITVEEENENIIRVFTFVTVCFGIVSFFATSFGFTKYIYTDDKSAYLAYIWTVAIQLGLLILNLKMPSIVMTDNTHKPKWIQICCIILAYLLLLGCSGLMAFTHMANVAYEKSKLPDTHSLYQSKYEEYAADVRDYCDKGKEKALDETISKTTDLLEKIGGSTNNVNISAKEKELLDNYENLYLTTLEKSEVKQERNDFATTIATANQIIETMDNQTKDYGNALVEFLGKARDACIARIEDLNNNAVIEDHTDSDKHKNAFYDYFATDVESFDVYFNYRQESAKWQIIVKNTKKVLSDMLIGNFSSEEVRGVLDEIATTATAATDDADNDLTTLKTVVEKLRLLFQVIEAYDYFSKYDADSPALALNLPDLPSDSDQISAWEKNWYDQFLKLKTAMSDLQKIEIKGISDTDSAKKIKQTTEKKEIDELLHKNAMDVNAIERAIYLLGSDCYSKVAFITLILALVEDAVPLLVGFALYKRKE